MKNFPVQLSGIIYWLPSHRSEKNRFPPNYKFLAGAKFTSDFHAPDMDAVVSYSSIQEPIPNSYEVRLFIRVLEGREDELKRLAKNSEILLMDAYKVIAVCRDITLPESKLMMDDEWSD